MLFRSETIDAFYNSTTNIGHTMFSTPGANAVNINGTLPSGVTEEKEIIVATFGTSAGQDTLDSSAHISPLVPEPVSMGLMGAGLLGLGVLGYRRKRK